MGFWGNILSSVRGGSAFFTPSVTYLGAPEFSALLDPSAMTAAQMWKTQPHFRTVVSFMARNIAQLGLHSFERVDQNDRRRDRESVFARTMRSPDGFMTEFELKFALVGDLCLYDRAYWWATTSSETASGWMLRRLPPTWVEPVMKNQWEVDHYRVFIKKNGQPVDVPAKDILAFPGYHPGRMHGSSPTVDALRETLHEQVEAAKYRSQVWKRGGRVSSVLERPKDAPAWSETAREAFREDWYSKYTGRGSKAGGTPLLEDGMTLKRIDFNAQEQQFVEAAKLSLVTVASAFHINPTMIGQNDGANYSNVREFRKMLYGDTLGPVIAQIEDRINTFLLERMGMDSARFYVEFNIDEKLQGNFEEQSSALQSATGAPYMTRNEARSFRNLPSVDGGDDLVTPLNVLIGGHASPVDGQTAGGGGGSSTLLASSDDIAKRVTAAASLIRSGFAPKASLAAVGLDPVEHLGPPPVAVQRPEAAENPDPEIDDALKAVMQAWGTKGPSASVKAAPREQDSAAASDVLTAFFARQRAVVLSRLGSKDKQWWDESRWSEELADDLYALAMAVTAEIGAEALKTLGLEPDRYSTEKTAAFLRAVAESRAAAINAVTLRQIEVALDGGVDDEATRSTPAGVFDIAETSRASTAALTFATTLAAFATTEAARQVNREAATKTWLTTSNNPRTSHARLSGQTVGIDEAFSNGMVWPGDEAGGVDEVAGCTCIISVTIP